MRACKWVAESWRHVSASAFCHEYFRKSLSSREDISYAMIAAALTGVREYGREKEREREREREAERTRDGMPLSKKENGIEGESERGHFVCLVPHGDTRCMDAAMRIIANAGTPLSDRRGRQERTPANLSATSRSFHHQPPSEPREISILTLLSCIDYEINVTYVTRRKSSWCFHDVKWRVRGFTNFGIPITVSNHNSPSSLLHMYSSIKIIVKAI